MPTVTVVFEPGRKEAKVPLKSTIFYAAKEANINIRSECGGKGLCGKCKIIIKDPKAVSKITNVEKKHLSKSEIKLGYRLACQTKVLRDVKVIVPAESLQKTLKIQVLGLERKIELNPYLTKFHVKLNKPTLSDYRPDFERLVDALSDKIPRTIDLKIDYKILKELPHILRNANWDITVTMWNDYKIIAIEPGDTSNSLFGFAIDIGTSKVVGHLVDLTSGETVAVEAIENPQSVHGEDIITRITFASINKTNMETLQKLVVDGVNKVIRQACEKAHIELNKVYEIIVVGNTAMHHLFLGIQPKYLALSPYTPVIKKQIRLAARELNINANQGAVITILPVIAGFVGADAIADVLATGIYESEELSLLIDIGTNTEILLGNKDDILCCSCASGPAFEGAHIKHGMKAMSGAIEKISINSDFEVKYKTIGNTKPLGLCGSAMIDIVAEMLKRRIINQQGKFNVNIKTRRLRRINDEIEFIIVWGNETATGKEITITQKDIRAIQLAKAAIYAGCSLLMKRKNVKENDIDKIFIAGAFGNYLNLENAKTISLIPNVPTEKITFIGNAAVSGAKMALISKEMRKKAEEIANKVRYLEIASDPDFNQELIKALPFSHKN